MPCARHGEARGAVLPATPQQDCKARASAPAGADDTANLQATGQPDTPIECITALLQKALAVGGSAPGEVQACIEGALAIACDLDGYMERTSTPAPQAVTDLIQASLDHDWDAAHQQGKTQFKQKRECCAGTLQGRLLKALVAMSGAKHVLEVGMFTGTSSLAMAEALPEDGRLVALEIEPYMLELAQPAFEAAGCAERIRVMLGPAQESLAKLAAEGASFDFCFIDANKDGYIAYYDAIMDRQLLAPGGTIAVDNVLMKGRAYTPGGTDSDAMAADIAAFNQHVASDPRVELVMLPFRDGLSLIRRKQPATGDAVVRGVSGNSILQRFKLNGKAALITGAGQGIGRCWAHALGEAGASVAVVDVNRQAAEGVVEELRAKGVRAVAITADVRSAKDCSSMVEQAVAALGGLHIAINNAGINRNAAGEDIDERDWDDTFDVNTKGVFLCCQAEGKHMLAHGGGCIINTASMATLLVPHPQKQAAYNASKAAVVKLTQSLAAEWADRGVRVNCLSPGIVSTELITASPVLAPLVDTWLQQIPMGRLADVTDLQAAIVYLASDASSYMTGHNLVIEGGQSLW